jgi:hypothetical protein
MFDQARIEEYAAAIARRHRPQWSWGRMQWVCRCGGGLPCRSMNRLPVNRGHWSA